LDANPNPTVPPPLATDYVTLNAELDDAEAKNINCNILTVVAIMLHPNVMLGLGWCEPHLEKTLREAAMPAKFRGQ
jgi:hypothetical protein